MSTMIASTTVNNQCSDSALIISIGRQLKSLSPPERELVHNQLIPSVLAEIYGNPRAASRGPENTFLDLLQGISEALAEFSSLRNVERMLFGEEFAENTGPMSATYLRVRAERGGDAAKG
jgi:hypothetical protein